MTVVVAVDLRFLLSSMNERKKNLFIGTKLHLLLITPAQIKCAFRLVAINM